MKELSLKNTKSQNIFILTLTLFSYIYIIRKDLIINTTTMTTQMIFYVIIWLLVFEFVLTKFLAYLNTLNWSDKLPKELDDIYNEKKYKKSQKYEKTKHKFDMISTTFSFIVILLVVVLWWFWRLDEFVRNYSENEIILSLYFFWRIMIFQTIITLPFSYYSNFVIEEKYWFNKMTKKLFFIDTIKWLLLWALIWWWLIALIVWTYTKFWDNFWLLAWLIMTLFSVFFMMFYSTLIVPLFNKQTPLEKWKLRDAIESFSKKVWFKLDNIFIIDWSKRSSKANAYFSWLWSKKRIVLYDTLVNDLSVDELVGVLAHEIWHYKKKHTLQMLAFSIIQTWFMLYIFSLALKIPEVSYALWAKEVSFYIGSIAFGILFTPISIIMWLFSNVLSRKNEYEADKFAKDNHDGSKLVTALKKLSINNLSNLRPHNIYEFFYYSHPTVLKRIKALKK